MTAPPSPAFSEISISFCCSEEGSDEKADSDYCSPELKRAKRQDSAHPSPRIEHTLKKKFLKSTFHSGVIESGSHLPIRSVANSRSSHGIGHDQNSHHSLPTLDFKGLTHANSLHLDRQLSLEVLGDVDLRDDSEQFERRSSLDAIHRIQANDEAAVLKNDRKTRVVSSYYNHMKENHQLVGSDRGSHKTDLTGSTKPSHHTDDLEYLNGFGAENEAAAKEVEMKLGSTETPHESGEGCIRKIMMPVPLETLIGSTEYYENLSTTNSFPKDEAPQEILRSTESAESEATETARTPETAGDSHTWISHVEKEYKSELEFSTLVTLAYVRVRDLTNTINKAYSYLEAINRKDIDELKEIDELRSGIRELFEERATLALEHSKWRSKFSELYQRRKKVLSNFKSQAALAEHSYFRLRKELEDLQNEPIIKKPRRGWFSRLCAFIK